ncbi:MAG: NTP transferase domain-containing protein [Phycisphaerae bacterium]|nr:NTP transferase domain-containing protein [Planctomycetota bacterium]MBL7133979.1 NTP transferase domain-containing protein [Phycisphaerae bacterium]
MKGVILAGGLGTRLWPLTKITNKHLLPVYAKPMVYYPLECLVRAGVKDIMIVTGGTSAGDFIRLLENGEEFGLSRLHYAYQKGEGGIAEALGLAREFAGDDKVCVVLGDNILERSIRPAVEVFERQIEGARIFLKEVENPQAYGIAEIAGDRIVRIIEKPDKPPTNFAVIGVYMYPPDVFDVIGRLEPSARGELEITDVNNHYIRAGTMTYEVVEGWWADAGESIDSWLAACNRVAKAGAEQVE